MVATYPRLVLAVCIALLAMSLGGCEEPAEPCQEGAHETDTGSTPEVSVRTPGESALDETASGDDGALPRDADPGGDLIDDLPPARDDEAPGADSGTPVDDPADDPVDEPADAPDDDPAANPADEPDDDPVDDPADEPDDDPADEPDDDPVDEPDDDPVDEPADDPADDVSPPEEPTPVGGDLPEIACEAPVSLLDDPLTVITVNQVDQDPLFGGSRVHLVDIDYDPGSERLYGAGYGGLYVFDVDAEDPALIGHITKGVLGNASEVAALPGNRVAIGAINTAVYVFNASDLDGISQVASLIIDGPTGMAFSGSTLHVLSLEGTLSSFPAATLSGDSIAAGHTMDGLSSPRELVISGDVAYIADNDLGLVIVDMSQEEAPSVLGSVETSGGPQGLSVEGDLLFVASGLAGVDIFDISSATDPVLLSTVVIGDSVVGVDASEGILWATDQTSVAIVDVTDPSAPVLLAKEETEQFTMDVWADGSTAFVADWERLITFDADPAIAAPDIELLQDTWFIGPSQHGITLKVVNYGAAALEVLGFAATDPRISLSADSFGVAPGAQIELDIALGDASLPETFSWEICLVTNDPDEPLLTLTIASTDSNTDGALGSQAPDFVAEDLDGGLHALSDHLGQPVLLAFFATWCPICAYETSDIDKALYQVYADQGLVVYGVGAADPKAALEKFVKQFGLTFPVLFDNTGAIEQKYFTETNGAFAIYPQEWLIGIDGTIRYVSTSFDAAELAELIEDELSKMAAP